MNNMTIECKRVLALIPEGMEKPIKCEELVKLTGYKSTEVRSIINTLVRIHGYKIGACNRKNQSGYYISTNELEQAQAENNLISRISSMTGRLNALEKNSLVKLTTNQKPMPLECKKVLSLIPDGMDRPMKCKEIVALTGFNESQVRSIIHTLIKSYGFVIGACNRVGQYGYYVAQNEEEKAQAINNLSSRIKAVSNRLSSLMTATKNEAS